MTTSMDDITAAQALSALGNEKRLQVFRLLVKAGRDGLNIGEIQFHLAIPPSTLAHHIAALTRAGLVTQTREGRETICHADYEMMEEVFSFMRDQCCTGVEAAGRTA